MRLRILALVAMAACADERIEGASCDDQPNECIDGASLWNCASGEWVRVECANYCASIDQEAGGCLVSEDGDVCRCVPAEGASCTAEAAPPKCVGDYSLEACIEGHVRTERCAFLCAHYENKLTAGCFYEPLTREEGCLCVEEGEACDGRAHAMCVSADRLFHCGDYGWLAESCASICAPAAPIGCAQDVSGVAECLCAD